MEPLTYEQLFDILRREKSRDELQKLPEEFYMLVEKFLNEKKVATGSQGEFNLTAQRASIEYQNVKKILKELYDRRERKILTLAMHKMRTSMAIIETNSLEPRERELFDQVSALMLQTRKDLLQDDPSMMQGYSQPMPPPVVPQATTPGPTPEPAVTSGVSVKEPDLDADAEERVGVKFMAAVPKFVGKNMEIFGPFQEGDETELPISVVGILEKKGRVQRMEKPVQSE
jgi:DNA replication initiation complex subunit (GINS family)